MTPHRSILVFSLLASAFSTVVASAGQLNLEERVAAQEAIERVYYSHRMDSVKRFEDAVSRELSKHKVTTYMKQSVASPS